MIRLGCLLMVVIAVATYAHAEEELYSDKYDYIDPKDIVENDRLRDQYYHCFMDTAPCVTPDALFFKEHLPEAVVTKCRKCTEHQKRSFAYLVEWYNDNRPEEWNALLEKMVEKHGGKV